MKKIHLLIALGAVLTAITGARADEIKFPDTAPAFSVNVPDGWTSTVSGSNLVLKNAATGGVISLVVVNDAASVQMPIDQFAAQVFTAAGIKNIDKKETAHLAGIPGMAYYGSITSASGVNVNVKVIIIHMDTTHIAALTRAAQASLDPAKLKATDQFIDSIKLAQ
jgi:hypothetical protein